MTLEIISAHEVLFRGDAEAVTLPGAEGSFTVLRNHAPIVSVLAAGNVKYRTPEGNEREVAIKGGLVYVADNVVSVCIY